MSGEPEKSVNYRRMATFVATVIASIGAMNWGCQAMGCNLVEKIMPRGAVKPTYIIIALFGLVALVFAVLTYWTIGSYAEHYSAQYGGPENSPQTRDATTYVSSSDAYSSLAGMY